MKIGIISRSFDQGGIERVIIRLLPLFRRGAYTVVVFSELGKESNVMGGVPNHRRVVIGSGVDRQTHFRKGLEREKIDICLVEDYWRAYMPEDCNVLMELGIPYIVHIHNVFSEFFLLPVTWRDKSTWYSVFAKASSVITLSKNAEYFFRLIGCNAHYIPNPVEDVPEGYERKESKHSILWVARISPIKRPKDAISIFRKVLARFPDATLTMLGGTRSKIAKEIIREVQSDSVLTNSVRIPGFSDRIWDFYSTASVFLSTSAMEGAPCTFMEAAAAGVPIVGYNLPYVEYVRGNAGFIPIEQGNVNAAADAICKLFENDEERAKAGAANRATFERIKSFDQMAAYGKLFEDVRRGVRAEPPQGDEVAQLCLKTLTEHAMLGIARLKKDVNSCYDTIKRLKKGKRRKNRLIAALATVSVLLAALLLSSAGWR